jgi:hypothetical protein
MEMSELMQGQAMFAQEYDMLKVMETGKTDNLRTVAENSSFGAADLSFRPNSDGYCTIPKISYELNKDYKEWQDSISTPLGVSTEKPAKEETKEDLQELNKILKGNYIQFKLDANNRLKNTQKGINHLIYTDPALIQYYIPKRQSGTTVLTFLDITLGMDGLSGLSCGEYFQIDGIPEIYNKNGYFQITNVKHGLNESDWKTTIEASYLLKSIDVDESKTNLNGGKPYKERIIIDPSGETTAAPKPKPKPVVIDTSVFDIKPQLSRDTYYQDQQRYQKIPLNPPSTIKGNTFAPNGQANFLKLLKDPEALKKALDSKSHGYTGGNW